MTDSACHAAARQSPAQRTRTRRPCHHGCSPHPEYDDIKFYGIRSRFSQISRRVAGQYMCGHPPRRVCWRVHGDRQRLVPQDQAMLPQLQPAVQEFTYSPHMSFTHCYGACLQLVGGAPALTDQTSQDYGGDVARAVFVKPDDARKAAVKLCRPAQGRGSDV